MAASPGDIRAGKAYVELAANDGALRSGLDAAANYLKSWGKTVMAAGAGLKGFAGMFGVSTEFLDRWKELINLGGNLERFRQVSNEMNTLSLKTGAAVEKLSELQYVFEVSGADWHNFAMSVKHMQKTLSEAGEGGKKATHALARLGLVVKDFEGMDPVDQFNRIADALAAIEDPTKRISAAMDIFWVRTGQQLMPVLSQGVEGLRKFRKEAEQLGLVMSTDAAVTANELTDAYYRLNRIWGIARNTIGQALAPTMIDFTAAVSEHVMWVKAWAVENRGLILSAAKGAAVLAGLGVALTAVGVALNYAGGAVALLSKALGVANGLFVFMQTYTGMATLAVSGLAYAWTRFTPEGAEAAREIGKAFEGMGESFFSSKDSIIAALKAGDLQLAFEVVGLAIESEWKRLMVALERSWKAFNEAISTTARRAYGASQSPAANVAARTGVGLVGAGLGARMGGAFGWPGRIIGGIAGYVAGGQAGNAATDEGSRAWWLDALATLTGGGIDIGASSAHELEGAAAGAAAEVRELTAAELALADAEGRLAEAQKKKPKEGAVTNAEKLRRELDAAKDSAEGAAAAMFNLQKSGRGDHLDEGRIHAAIIDVAMTAENLAAAQAAYDEHMKKGRGLGAGAAEAHAAAVRYNESRGMFNVGGGSSARFFANDKGATELEKVASNTEKMASKLDDIESTIDRAAGFR